MADLVQKMALQKELMVSHFVDYYLDFFFFILSCSEKWEEKKSDIIRNWERPCVCVEEGEKEIEKYFGI